MILLITLGIASLYDIKTMEVPLFLWSVPILTQTIYYVSMGEWRSLLISFVFAIFCFLLFWFLSCISNFGGADVLLLTSIAFVCQKNFLIIAWFAFLFSLPYVLWMFLTKTERPYPFVPFLFIATVFFLFFKKFTITYMYILLHRDVLPILHESEIVDAFFSYFFSFFSRGFIAPL